MRYALFALVTSSGARVFATPRPVDKLTASLAVLRRLGELGVPSGPIASAWVDERPAAYAAVFLEEGTARMVALVDDEEARLVRALAASIDATVEVAPIEWLDLEPRARAVSDPRFCPRCQDHAAAPGDDGCGACRRLDEWRRTSA